MSESIGCGLGDSVSLQGSMKVTFYANSSFTDTTALKDLFVEAYNSVSPGCDELFQRSMVNSTLENQTMMYEMGTGFIETWWSAVVSCWPKCPVEPLFGSVVEDDHLQVHYYASL